MTQVEAQTAVFRDVPVEVAVSDKVAFLGAVESHVGERPGRVEVRETHMSWVFLTDHFAYKLKKPVRHARVDLRALDARRRNCATEIHLNRRLAPDVYLAVKPLTFAAHHGLQLAGDGNAVEWLVMMRRLPDELMLDRALRGGGPERRDLDRIASRLARFYGGLAPEPVAPGVRGIWLEKEIRLSRREVARPAFAQDAALIDRVARRLSDSGISALSSKAPTAAGCIREYTGGRIAVVELRGHHFRYSIGQKAEPPMSRDPSYASSATIVRPSQNRKIACKCY